jgi:hypothetical protein
MDDDDVIIIVTICTLLVVLAERLEELILCPGQRMMGMMMIDLRYVKDHPSLITFIVCIYASDS